MQNHSDMFIFLQVTQTDRCGADSSSQQNVTRRKTLNHTKRKTIVSLLTLGLCSVEQIGYDFFTVNTSKPKKKKNYNWDFSTIQISQAVRKAVAEIIMKYLCLEMKRTQCRREQFSWVGLCERLHCKFVQTCSKLTSSGECKALKCIFKKYCVQKVQTLCMQKVVILTAHNC